MDEVPVKAEPTKTVPAGQTVPTHGQRLMLTGQQLHPEAPLYNQAFAFEIQGTLDPDLFQGSLRELIRQCEALRTVRCVETDEQDAGHGEPGLALLPPSIADDFQLQIEDLSHSDEGTFNDCRASADRWLSARAQRLFVDDEPLFDTALLKLSEQHWIWYLCQHHVVTDAWSMAVIFRRMSEIYGKAERNQPLDFEPLPSFQDEVERLNQRPIPETARAHWREQAEAAQRSSGPPRLFGRKPSTTAGRRLDLNLGRDRSDALKAMARRPETGALSLDLGLFNLFATLLMSYLYRLGGGDRIALGAPFHNRSGPKAADVAGLLIEVFPMGVELEPHITFVELLGRVRIAGLDFLRHAGPGLAEPALQRGFHSLLNYIRGSFGPFAGRSTTTEWLYPGHHDREHALRLHVHDFDGGITGQGGELKLQLDLDQHVFEGSRSEDAVDHLSRLVDAMIEDWDRPIESVPLVDPAVLEIDRTPENDGLLTVLELIESSIHRSPDRAAITGRGVDDLTYQQLDQVSRGLAGRLREASTGPFVGILMPRCPEAVIAMLAIQRAGLAYVPLDPAWPAKRLQWACDDAGLSLVLTQGLAANPRAAELPPGLRTLEVRLDTEESGTGPDPSVKLPTPSPEDPSYLLYTSGSTGRPKGVVISHRALANYVDWARRRYDVGSPPTYPLFSPLTFDLTVTSIFVPLASAGTIRVYPETDRRADLALLDVVDEGRVDVIKLTPSHLALLRARSADTKENDRDDAGTRRRVQRLILGGEALGRSAALEAMAFFGTDVQIHNEYGPTEATVGCVEHLFQPDQDPESTVPIGRAIQGMGVAVLDRYRNPVPEGVTGELYVRGHGLAQGYQGREDLTAERFVSLGEHRDAHPGARWYRTGDRVRWLIRGSEAPVLEYLGRTDDQLKVRGARIEPGEVEAALVEHPAIEAAVVGVVDTVAVDIPRIAEAGSEAKSTETEVHCRNCGLSSRFPGTEFDADGVCNHCNAFARYRHQVDGYFRTLDDLRSHLDPIRDHRLAGSPDAPPYDCLSLLSGGKDSTYALGRLVDMGYKVLAFTLDNGFISEQAKDNVRRVVSELEVDHVFGSTPAMGQIFADSLDRFANVCQGCFKTIYTLSLRVAAEKKIPFIVTGLSRGQLFETRLTPELFENLEYDAEQIDRSVLQARKAYHRMDDAVSRLLDVSHLSAQLFDQVQFLDFYRFCDVELDEMLDYLDQRVPWIRPTDTGRSTNCLINDLGIWVHRRQRGFHNYALPYSWDVRLGHKTREAALAELDDELDEAQIQEMMREVGYQPKAPHGSATAPSSGADSSTPAAKLVAWYTLRAKAGVEPSALQDFLRERLPDFMVPSLLQPMDTLPMTAHGKVDRRALAADVGDAPLRSPRPADSDAQATAAPETPLQKTLAAIWREILGVGQIGLDDNFYDLGGDSIGAIRISAKARRQGLGFEPAELFDAPTVRGLAESLAGRLPASDSVEEIPQDEPGGPALLLPSQAWCLEQLKASDEPGPWNQVITVGLRQNLDTERLRQALGRVAAQHDALRLRFSPADHGEAVVESDLTPELREVQLDGMDRDALAGQIFTLHRAPLWTVTHVKHGEQSHSLIWVAHHLVVDALSWPILLDDLQSAYPQASDGVESATGIPARPTVRSWARRLHDRAGSAAELSVEPWLKTFDGARGRLESMPEASTATTPPEHLEIRLDASQTDPLLQSKGRRGPRVFDALVTATADLLAHNGTHASGSSADKKTKVVMFTEGHGRELGGADASRDPSALDAASIVGWLGCLYPVAVELGPESSDDPAALLDRAHQALQEIPNGGLDYGVLRRLSPDEDLRRRLAELEGSVDVLLNYLGRADQLVPTGDLFEFDRPLALKRAHGLSPFTLEIDAWIEDPQLCVRFRFPSGRRLPRAEEQLRRFEQQLQTMSRAAGNSVAGAEPAPTTADFPLANLNSDKLAKLSAVLGRGPKS